MTNNFNITIIGSSFAGMSAALALSNISPDLKIALIEKEDIIKNNRKSDGRGYAISNISLNLFKEIGIFEEIKKNAGTIQNIQISEYQSPTLLNFLSKEVEEENFGLLIESYIIHNALRDKVLQCKNINLFCQTSYKNINFFEDNVEVEINDNQKINSKLLLACDGRFSLLRKHFNIHTIVKNYHQNAIVFNIWHQKEHKNIAFEKFVPNGILAILPLANPNQSSIVWIAKTNLAQTILELDEENFSYQLAKIMENCLGEIKIISQKFSYPLIMVEADKFYHQKMLLVGDAACGVHPIAGQGLNLGLYNIQILQELIKKYFLCGLDISSKTLIEEYNKRAKKNAVKMAMATDILNSIFENNGLLMSCARNIGIGLVNKIPKLKKLFINNAGGLK